MTGVLHSFAACALLYLHCYFSRRTAEALGMKGWNWSIDITLMTGH
jgi:hypothetical protein